MTIMTNHPLFAIKMTNLSYMAKTGRTTDFKDTKLDKSRGENSFEIYFFKINHQIVIIFCYLKNCPNFF